MTCVTTCEVLFSVCNVVVIKWVDHLLVGR